MADVWILADARDGGDSWKSNVKAVVLPSKKVISRSKRFSSLISKQISMAESMWAGATDDNSSITTEAMYNALNRWHGNPYSMGVIVPVEDAREYIKQSGGF